MPHELRTKNVKVYQDDGTAKTIQALRGQQGKQGIQGIQGLKGQQGEPGSEYTVMVQDEQPTQRTNKLWIKQTPEPEIQIPTMEDLQPITTQLADHQSRIEQLEEGGGVSLDPTLTDPTKAAPADAVGKIKTDVNSYDRRISRLEGFENIIIANENAEMTYAQLRLLPSGLYYFVNGVRIDCRGTEWEETSFGEVYGLTRLGPFGNVREYVCYEYGVVYEIDDHANEVVNYYSSDFFGYDQAYKWGLGGNSGNPGDYLKRTSDGAEWTNDLSNALHDYGQQIADIKNVLYMNDPVSVTETRDRAYDASSMAFVDVKSGDTVKIKYIKAEAYDYPVWAELAHNDLTYGGIIQIKHIDPPAMETTIEYTAERDEKLVIIFFPIESRPTTVTAEIYVSKQSRFDTIEERISNLEDENLKVDEDDISEVEFAEQYEVKALQERVKNIENESLKVDEADTVEVQFAQEYEVNSLQERVEALEQGKPKSVSNDSYDLRLAKIQYIDFESDYWGNTLQEKAQNIARFDVHVSGGITNTSLPIIRRAREINPRLKICYYISVASGRPWYDTGWYTFRRGGVWDENWGNQQSIQHNNVITRPSNKWEILQQIEWAHHVGGVKSSEREFIETYTWTDDKGVSHSQDKYIYKYKGGESFDGFFWDDVGFDTIIRDGLFYESDNSTEPVDTVKRQGFKSRRDKYICINQFARDRGMFVIPNSINKDDLYDPAVSDSNPDGLGSSLTENDYVFIESCLTMVGTSNSVIWRNEIPRAVEYYKNWYPTVKAKCICEDYMTSAMDEKLRDKLVTFMMATYAAIGVHYFALTDIDTNRPSNDLYVPNIFKLPVPNDPDERNVYLTNPSKDVYRYSFAGNSLYINRENVLTSGAVDEYGVTNGTKIVLNGNRVSNAFISNAEVHAELTEEVESLSKSLNDALSDTKRNASIYNKLMIDDWSVQKLEYENIIDDNTFRTWAEASVTKNESRGATTTFDVDDRRLAWELPVADNSYQSEWLRVKIGPEHYGHRIEFGFKLETQGNGVGAWIDASIDGNLWFQVGANPSEGQSTLYPNTPGMLAKTTQLMDYGTRDYIQLTLICSWNNNATSAVMEKMYIIDLDEFSEDITKDSYTNLLPGAMSAGGYSNPHLLKITSQGDRDFTVQMLQTATVVDENGEYPSYIEGNGPAWWVDAPMLLKQGHTYQIGIEDYEVTNGTIAFNFGVGTDNGTLCGDIPLQRKIRSKINSADTYNKIFTIPEDATLNSSLLTIRYFLAQGETTPGSFSISGWYLYDVDQEGVIIRGLSPSNTNIRIARVTDENYQADMNGGRLLNNTLYITETGKMYITDINRKPVTIVG